MCGISLPPKTEKNISRNKSKIRKLIIINHSLESSVRGIKKWGSKSPDGVWNEKITVYLPLNKTNESPAKGSIDREQLNFSIDSRTA